MKALASFVMRGQTQAMIAVVGFAALSLFMPLVSYLSAATVALVTMRLGAVRGLMLIIASSLFLALVSMVSSYAMGMMSTMMSLMMLILLLWMLSVVLRQSKSMAITLFAAAGIGAFIVIGFHLAITDPLVWWQTSLREFFGPAIEQAGSDSEDMYALIDSWAPHMTGFLASAIVVNSVLCLFIARWWQAMLYNPGGFQEEFHSLRLGQRFAIATLVLGVLAWLPLGYGQILAQDLLMIMMMIYVIQGLAVIHAVIAIKQLQKPWLFGAYIAVLIMSQLVAMIGFVDTWADLRQRLARKNAS